MHRFITVTGCALLLSAHPVHAAPKPKPPAISVCYGNLCLTNLTWRSSGAGSSFSAIEGLVVNNSNVTISHVTLQFALISGAVLYGTAPASYAADIPPGGRWFFSAQFLDFDGRNIVSKSESVSLSAWVNGRAPGGFNQTLRFDPLFSPINSSERKQWEKIHGKRQR
jgi:hypothetical protein